MKTYTIAYTVFSALAALTAPSVVEAVQNQPFKRTGQGSFTINALNDNGLEAIDIQTNIGTFTTSQLNSDAEILSTLDEVKAFNEQHGKDVRLQEVDGTYVLIKHSETKHIGNVTGDALTYVTGKLGQPGNKDAGAVPASCSHDLCITVFECSDGCHFCYPVICI